jgi:GT2 family glycosyltransferase/glycosyltransferase involved in cell wall biosynthesis
LITYRIPDNIKPEPFKRRIIISTIQGGRIAIDHALLTLWQQADGHSLDDILKGFASPSDQDELGFTPEAIRAALACLAEADLLVRTDHIPISTPMEHCTGDLVSAIIVNYNNLEWLQECLPSLITQTYTPIEIIIIDNGSTVDAKTWITENYPIIKTLILEPGHSFAYALNRGVELAQGKYFLLLNPDTYLEPDAIAQMVARVNDEPECAAVAAKLKLWWAPNFLNGLGNQVGAFSWGRDNGLGHLDLGQFDTWLEVPSACFAATLIPRLSWESIGQIDEKFQMYYEDAEWSYRARLLGFRILAAPQATIYHAFGGYLHTGTEDNISPSKLKRVIYGRLRFATKLTSGFTTLRFFIGYGMEDACNMMLALLRLDRARFYSVLGGWQDFFSDFRQIAQARRLIQSHRKCNDQELFSLQRQIPPPFIWHGIPELTQDLIANHYLQLIRAKKTKPMPEFPPTKSTRNLLIISQDIVDKKMAGPGIRYLEMARALADSLDVTLAIPGETSLSITGIKLFPYHFEQPAPLKALAETSDIILISSFILEKFPFLNSLAARQVIDLYDPIVLENLHYYQDEPIDIQLSLNIQAVQAMNHLVSQGDFFICGNERQRDFWLGVLTSSGRINPHTFARDASLTSLIDVVGVGFPDRLPVHHPFLRGVHPAFPMEAKIVLWGGGIWDWLDPLSLVKAWPQVLIHHPQARLVFLGTRHPNPDVPRHKMADATEALATEINQNGRTIFFYEWLPYEDYEALLCEADVGVALHPIHVETRYSIRTRVLDYLWARLPVMVSEGDVTSEWIRQYQIGVVAPALDVDAITKALITLLSTPKEYWQPAFAPLAQLLTWSHVIEPLKRYCLDGAPAADLSLGHTTIPTHPASTNFYQTWQQGLARARYIYHTEGFRWLLHRAWRYIQWKLSNI